MEESEYQSCLRAVTILYKVGVHCGSPETYFQSTSWRGEAIIVHAIAISQDLCFRQPSQKEAPLCSPPLHKDQSASFSCLLSIM